MKEEKLLKILIEKLIIEQNTKLRSSKGYNASHPIISHKPFMLGLGSSEYEDDEDDIEKNKIKTSIEKVKLSKVFDKEDIGVYANVLKELINAKKLYKTIC